MDIDIVTVVPNEHYFKYARFLKKTAELLASGNNNLLWKAVYSSSCNSRLKFFQTIAEAPNVKNKDRRGGVQHGIGLNMSIEHLTSPYTIIVDPDVAILKHNWDVDIINKIQQYDIVGTEYGKGRQTSCYQDFPNIFFMITKTDILKNLNIDFRPGIVMQRKRHYYMTCNNERSIIFNIPVGEKLELETGWNVCLKYKQNELKGYCLAKKEEWLTNKLVKYFDEHEKQLLINTKVSTKYNAVRKNLFYIMHEYYLENDLFLSHFKQANLFGFDHPIVKIWRKAVKKHINGQKTL